MKGVNVNLTHKFNGLSEEGVTLESLPSQPETPRPSNNMRVLDCISNSELSTSFIILIIYLLFVYSLIVSLRELLVMNVKISPSHLDLIDSVKEIGCK